MIGGDYSQTDLSTGERYEPMKEPRFTGIASFMRAPLAESFENVQFVIVRFPPPLYSMPPPLLESEDDPLLVELFWTTQFVSVSESPGPPARIAPPPNAWSTLVAP